MEDNKRSVFPVRNLVLMGVLIAMQVVLARFLGIQINEGLRVSFECIPIILAGFWLGPISGMLVGAVSDILGTVLSGYGAYFPLLTVGPMLLGALCGLGGKWAIRHWSDDWKGMWRFLLVVIVAECVNSLLYGTWALTLYYSIIVGKEMPFTALFLARLATKPATILVDAIVACLVHRATYKPVIRPYLKRAAQY